DDADQVQDPRRPVALVLAVELDQQLPQCGLDSARRRVLRAPDLVANRQMALQSSPGSRIELASSGPWEPAAYCGSGPGVFSNVWTIGSQISHCASTSSLRVKSVASPRIASMISRS